MNYTILIADDEPEIRTLLRLYLENENYQITVQIRNIWRITARRTARLSVVQDMACDHSIFSAKNSAYLWRLTRKFFQDLSHHRFRLYDHLQFLSRQKPYFYCIFVL